MGSLLLILVWCGLSWGDLITNDIANIQSNLCPTLLANPETVEKGIECLHKQIETNPSDSSSYFHLAKHYIYDSQTKDIQKGLPYFKQLLQFPEYKTMLLGDYALLCRMTGNNEESIWAYNELLKLQPNHIHANAQLAYMKNANGKNEETLNHLKKAFEGILALKTIPENEVNVISNYVMDLLTMLRPQHTLLVETAKKAFPLFATSPVTQAKLLCSIGASFNSIHQPLEAVKFLKRSNKLYPYQIETNFELGKSYAIIGDLQLSAEHYGIAAAQSPNNAVIRYSYGLVLSSLQLHEYAEAQLEVAHQLEPHNLQFLFSYMHVLKLTCNWDKFYNFLDRVKDKIISGELLSYIAAEVLWWGFTNEIIYKYTVHSAQKMEKPFALQYHHPLTWAKADKKLKIGYVSSNFINHAQGTQMTNFFKLHDRNNFEIYGFSLRPPKTEEALRQANIIQAQMDHFHDISILSDELAAKKIYDEGIDILIDLCGLADGTRLAIFSYRPAPVQISFLGYPGTTGASFLDYYIGDKISTPLPDFAGFYSEKLIIMPHTYQVTEHKGVYPPPLKNFEGIDMKRVIYCNFNGPVKISPEIFNVWMNILKKVPGSVLWLLDRSAKTNLLEYADRMGVEKDRIIFFPSIEKEKHMKRLAQAHLYLDTTVYGAHTSAGDALWSGLPILTILGDTQAERVCASMIDAVGLFDEMVVNSLHEYEERAVEWGRNPHVLVELRKRITETVEESPLFDTGKYVGDLERTLRHVWHKACRAEPPGHVVVEAI